MAMRMWDHFLRSTPKVGLEIILNVPPINLFLEFEVGRSYHRLRGTLKNPLYASHGICHIEAERLAFQEAQLDVVKPDL